MFSVVIPLYNKELSIIETINSVLGQDFDDYEIIVINDGSTDNSRQKVYSIIDSRIRIIDQANGGVSSARNRGINEAKYEWIAFLDGDDLWKNNHLQTFKKMITNYSEYKVFCTSYITSNQVFPDFENNSEVIIDDYFYESSKKPFCWTSITCVNKSVLTDVGGFNVQLNRGEDLDLWARIGRKYKFVKSNIITGIYRIDAENRSNLINYDIKRSFLSVINLTESGLSQSEYLYKRKMLKKNIMRFLKSGKYKELFFVAKKLIR